MDTGADEGGVTCAEEAKGCKGEKDAAAEDGDAGAEPLHRDALSLSEQEKLGKPWLSQTKLRLPCNVEPSSHSQDLASVEPKPARPVLFPCAGLSLMPAFLPLEPARFTLLIAPRSSFSPPRPLEPTSLSRRSFVPESPAPRPSLLLCRTRMPRFSAPGFPPV